MVNNHTQCLWSQSDIFTSAAAKSWSRHPNKTHAGPPVILNYWSPKHCWCFLFVTARIATLLLQCDFFLISLSVFPNYKEPQYLSLAITQTRTISSPNSSGLILLRIYDLAAESNGQSLIKALGYSMPRCLILSRKGVPLPDMQRLASALTMTLLEWSQHCRGFDHQPLRGIHVWVVITWKLNPLPSLV